MFNEEEKDEQEVEYEKEKNEQEVANKGLRDVIGAKYLKMEKSVCFFRKFNLCGRSSS